MNLKDAVALITGGGSGLGEATAREFAGAGARIAILDLQSSPGAKVAESFGDRGMFVAADVVSADGAAEAVAKAVARFATIHVAVNCAGIGRAMRTVTREGPHSLELFNKVIQVNLVGTFNGIRLAAAQMAKNQPNSEGERGVIVNTASVAAFDGQIGQAAYSASKGGVVAMTLPIARDLASLGIRICTIAPGTFDTPMLAGLPGSGPQGARSNHPISVAAGAAGGVRGAGAPYRGELDAQRRDDPARRRPPDGPALACGGTLTRVSRRLEEKNKRRAARPLPGQGGGLDLAPIFFHFQRQVRPAPASYTLYVPLGVRRWSRTRARQAELP